MKRRRLSERPKSCKRLRTLATGLLHTSAIGSGAVLGASGELTSCNSNRFCNWQASRAAIDSSFGRNDTVIKMGVIGYGYWGPNLVRNLFEVPDTEVVAVSDMRDERLG